MALGRYLGWLLILAALLCGARDAYQWHLQGTYQAAAASAVWHAIAPASLDRFEAAVERHLTPFAWAHLIEPLLALPAWAALGAPGLVLAFLFRRRARRHGRSARRFS